MRALCCGLLAGIVGCSAPSGEGPTAVPAPAPPPAETTWQIDSLEQIGDHVPVVLGNPRLVDADGARAIEFDGVDDGLEIALHPLAGAVAFTVEAVIRPAAGGPAEQRFLHLQVDGSEDRILLEIRVTREGQAWFLDTYVRSLDEGHTLFARQFEHPVGAWHHVALVVGNGRMAHFVDGRLELSRPTDFEPQGAGRTAVGMRANRVSWFKGAIRAVSFTPRPLGSEDFRLLDIVQRNGR